MAAAAGNNSHTSDSFSSLSSGIVKDSDHASSRITDAQDDEDSSSFLDRNRDTEHLITRDEIESPRAHDDIQLLRLIHIRSLPYWFHILMITFISLIGLGSYAAYDAVSAVQEELMKDLSLTPSQFGLLYSAYALPNVVLVIFGGTLVTRWGSHVVGLITTGLIAVGAIMVAWAPTMSLLSLKGRFTVMLIGRFIFGVGAESSYVVQNSMCVEWFFGDFLATAMAISAIGTRLGSIGSYALAPKIAVSSSSSPQGYTRALWVAAMTCVVSFLAVVGYTILRRYARSSLSSPRPSTSDVTYIELSEHLSNRTGMEDPQREDNLEYPDRPDSLPQAKPSTMRRLWNELKEVLIHIKNFSSLFWGCAVLGAFTYGIVLGFRAVVAEDMANRYKLSPEKSGLLMASIDITALFASPLIGWLVDWTLKMGWITLIGNSLSVASFLFFMPRISPYAGIILIGLSSATVPAAIYPAVSLLTSNSLEALAFGVMSSVINLSNLALNPLIGYSLQAGWFWMCLFLAFLSLMSVTVSLWWIIKDTKSENPVLDRPRDWSQEKHWISTNIPILSHTCS
jgi:MFS family permease